MTEHKEKVKRIEVPAKIKKLNEEIEQMKEEL